MGAAGRARQLSTPYQIGDEQCNDAGGDPTAATNFSSTASRPQLAQYILHGLGHGFRIGSQHGSAPLQRAGYNLQCPEPAIVPEYLSNELKLNRVVKLTDMHGNKADKYTL